jgi:hypothetical protein
MSSPKWIAGKYEPAHEKALFAITNLLTEEMVKEVIQLCLDITLNDYDAENVCKNIKMQIEREYLSHCYE